MKIKKIIKAIIGVSMMMILLAGGSNTTGKNPRGVLEVEAKKEEYMDMKEWYKAVFETDTKNGEKLEIYSGYQDFFAKEIVGREKCKAQMVFSSKDKKLETITAELVDLIRKILNANRRKVRSSETTMCNKGWIYYSNFNSKAMFTGMLIAIIGAQIFVWFTKKGFTIKMPEQVPPAVSKAFAAVVPAIVVIGLAYFLTEIVRFADRIYIDAGVILL